jgi:hypothetical protein
MAATLRFSKKIYWWECAFPRAKHLGGIDKILEPWKLFVLPIESFALG